MQFPTITGLPFTAIVYAGTGYLYGKVFKADVHVSTVAFTIEGLSKSIFYLISNFIFNSKGNRLTSARIKTVLDLTIDVAAIIAFRELNLIANSGTAFFGFIAFCRLINNANEITKMKVSVI
jgi:hypothetical protein